jgi:hypothetical protein
MQLEPHRPRRRTRLGLPIVCSLLYKDQGSPSGSAHHQPGGSAARAGAAARAAVRASLGPSAPAPLRPSRRSGAPLRSDAPAALRERPNRELPPVDPLRSRLKARNPGGYHGTLDMAACDNCRPRRCAESVGGYGFSFRIWVKDDYAPRLFAERVAGKGLKHRLEAARDDVVSRRTGGSRVPGFRRRNHNRGAGYADQLTEVCRSCWASRTRRSRSPRRTRRTRRPPVTAQRSHNARLDLRGARDEVMVCGNRRPA